MKRLKISLTLFSLLSINCSNDDKAENRCVICGLSDPSLEYQEFNICELENGNAGINGEDTGYDYDLIINEFNSDGIYLCN